MQRLLYVLMHTYRDGIHYDYGDPLMENLEHHQMPGSTVIMEIQMLIMMMIGISAVVVADRTGK